MQERKKTAWCYWVLDSSKCSTDWHPKVSDSYSWGELYWHLHCLLLGCACPRCKRRTCQFEWCVALRDTSECQPKRLVEILLMKLSGTGSSFSLSWATHHVAQTWIHLTSISSRNLCTSGLERTFFSVHDVKRAVKMYCCRKNAQFFRDGLADLPGRTRNCEEVKITEQGFIYSPTDALASCLKNIKIYININLMKVLILFF